MSLKQLPYQFQNLPLQEQALTHRSLGRHNNERLEFLGDALVNMMIAELLYEHYPKASEGDLTRLRASLVNGTALAQMARMLGLGDQLRLGSGELKSGGYRRDSILADAFEALIAAVYLDGGWDTCRQVVRTLFTDALSNCAADSEKDPKTRLQELLQAHAIALPQYELLSTQGEEHAKVFEVKCAVVALNVGTTGTGSSRRVAEQIAAELALAQVEAAMANHV